MTKPLERFRFSALIERRQQAADRFVGMSTMYGDTLPDGGHMMAKLQFGNADTVRAVSSVLARVGNRPAIAAALQNIADGKPSEISPDPDDQPRDPLLLYGEPARQVQGALEELADERYPDVDRGAVELARYLVAGSFRRGEWPRRELTAAEQAFYVPNQSYHEIESRAMEARIADAQAGHPAS